MTAPADDEAASGSYVRTLAEPLRHEIDKIKGSRFLASVAPVSTRDAVEAFLEARREEYRDATHNCYAWRLGQGQDDWRYSDDGEPSGTAGKPILQEIDGRRLTDIVVVVTRYYGGTKLGTGGLVRAYAAAAAEALDRAKIVERRITRSLAFTFDYAASSPVQGVLAARHLEPVTSDYGAEVHFELAVPVEQVEAVRGELIEATHGKIRFQGE